jgi:hypothetical protein
MPDESSLRRRLSARDDAARRLRTITWGVAVAMLVLAGVFAALAAQATAARKHVKTSVQETVARTARPARATVPPPPPLPAAGQGSQSTAPAPAAAAPTPPATPPTPAAAPPVVVSGGS